MADDQEAKVAALMAAIEARKVDAERVAAINAEAKALESRLLELSGERMKLRDKAWLDSSLNEALRALGLPPPDKGSEW